jgi:hypothetical protein
MTKLDGGRPNRCWASPSTRCGVVRAQPVPCTLRAASTAKRTDLRRDPSAHVAPLVKKKREKKSPLRGAYGAATGEARPVAEIKIQRSHASLPNFISKFVRRGVRRARPTCDERPTRSCTPPKMQDSDLAWSAFGAPTRRVLGALLTTVGACASQ